MSGLNRRIFCFYPYTLIKCEDCKIGLNVESVMQKGFDHGQTYRIQCSVKKYKYIASILCVHSHYNSSETQPMVKKVASIKTVLNNATIQSVNIIFDS